MVTGYHRPGSNAWYLEQLKLPPEEREPEFWLYDPNIPIYVPSEVAKNLGYEVPTGEKLAITPQAEGEPTFSTFAPETELFAPLPATPTLPELPDVEAAFSLMQTALPEFVSPEDTKEVALQRLIEVVEQDTDLFFETLARKGRSAETDALLKLLSPQITEEEVQAIYKPSLPEIPPEGLVLEGKNEKGESLPVVVRPDYSVWSDNQRIGVVNPTTQQFIPGEGFGAVHGVTGEYQPESFFTQFWNAVQTEGKRVLHQTGQYFVSTLPQKLFPDVEVGSRKKVPIFPGVSAPGVAKWSQAEVDWNRQMRDKFRFIYSNNETEYQEWVAKHKELQPKAAYTQAQWSDPGWWGYTIGKSLPFTLSVLGTTLGVSYATKNPFLGISAGTAIATPSQSQDLRDDLLAAGAPEQAAADIALPIGVVISSVEAVTDLPLLKAINPLFGGVKKKLTQDLARATVKNLLKKGIQTFGTVEVSEVLEEVAQSAIQNSFVRIYDENRAIFENVPETIIDTLVATAPFAIFGGASTMVHVRAEEAVRITVEQKRAEGWTQDSITKEWYRPELIVDVVQQSIDEGREAGLSKDEAILQALNEAARTPEGEAAIQKAVEPLKVVEPVIEEEIPQVAPEEPENEELRKAALSKAEPPVSKAEVPVVEEGPKAKLLRLVKEAKPARKVTEQMKHEELKKRVAIASRILEKGEGWKAFEESKSALKGQLPEADFVVDLEAVGIEDADIRALYDIVRKADIPYFTRLNTAAALDKVLIGQIPTEGEMTLLENMFGSELVEALLSKRTTWEKVRANLADIVNIPRTLQTILDFSATLRQGIVLVAGQPVQFAQAFKAQMKAVFSVKNAQMLDALNHGGQYAELREDSDLYVAPLDQAAAGVSQREESFMSRLIKKVPILGQIISASERAYVTFLNTLRVQTFDYYAKQWEGTGKTVEDYRKLASFINHATGRGDLGKLANAGSWLNAAFFSPRFVMSRIQVPLDLFNTTPAVRKIVARNLVAFVGSNMVILGLAALAGASVEDDPRSSDFGKMKVGNTRWDFWGGFLPYARLVTQLATGQRKVTKTGTIIPAEREDIIINFIRSKESPVVGFIHDLIRGETFLGEELSLSEADKIALERLTPMVMGDILDAIAESGWWGVPIALPSIFGVNVQSYSDNWNTNEKRLGIAERPLAFSNVPIVFDMKDYYSETARDIGTATYDILKDKKGIPPKVLAVAKARDIKRETGLLPNEKLIAINADPKKEGGTFETFYNQWQERTKLLEAGGKYTRREIQKDGTYKEVTYKGEEALKKFDSDNPNANLGNFNQREFALLKQFHSTTDKEAFLKEHPELDLNPRTEWLKAHPEENAYLAITGQARVLTQAAYDKARDLAKSLDIPEVALEGLLPSKEIAKPFFDYNEMSSKWGPMSPEAKLVRAKNTKLTEFLELEDIKTPVPALELLVKNRALSDKYEAYSDKKSLQYLPSIPNKADPNYNKGREYAREQLRLSNPEWVDDLQRVEAYEKGADETTVKGWVEYGQVSTKSGGSSSEAKVWLTDHPDIFKWALSQKLLTDDGQGWNVPVLRINAKYRKEDDAYDAIQSVDERKQASLREAYLQKNPAYAKARIERDGYNLGLKNVSQWTAYNQLPEKGFWRERYRKENPDFDRSVMDLQTKKGLKTWEAIDPSRIPSVQYDQLYEDNKELFDRYEAADERGKEALFNKFPGFKEKWRYRQGYSLLFPDQMVPTFVEYYNIPRKGYGNERFLMEHQDFYQEAITRLGWERIDFSKIPSEHVEKLWDQYQLLPTQRRMNFRIQNPELDEWLVRVKGYSPAKDGGTGISQYDAQFDEMERIRQRIDTLR